MSMEDLTARLTSVEQELDAERKAHDADRQKLEAARQAHDTDRQKLRKLEHLLLMAEKDRAGRSRSALLTWTLASTGLGAIGAMTPLCFVQLLGVTSDGAFGYALAVLLLGGTLSLLVATPAWSAWPFTTRLVRFTAAIFAWIAAFFACVYAILGSLAITDVHCGAWDEGVCDLIAIGMFAAGVVLVLATAGFAWTLRLIPCSERVPLSQLRAWATPKMGCCLATVATFGATPLVWAWCQPEDSFVLSPRQSLLRLWLVYRLANLGWCATWATVSALACARGLADVPVVPSLLVLAVVALLNALCMTQANRGRVQYWLGHLGSSKETSSAALLAAVVGGMDAKEAFESAQRAFSGISFDVLSIDDFAHGDLAGKDARDLKARTTRGLKLGQVDAFLSHSWRDDPHAKWAALEQWAANFARRRGGASPMLWLDKACIDQQNISASLAVLPVFLSGCRQLLIVPGPTYVHRLWCVMEVFTFIFMGGDLRRITLLPIGDDRTDSSRGSAAVAAVVPQPGSVEDEETDVVQTEESGTFTDRSDPAVCAILGRFATFDAAEAECYLPGDKQMILGVIESGIGSVAAFNKLVRTTFATGNPDSSKSKSKSVAATRSNTRGSVIRSSSQAIVIGIESSDMSLHARPK